MNISNEGSEGTMQMLSESMNILLYASLVQTGYPHHHFQRSQPYIELRYHVYNTCYQRYAMFPKSFIKYIFCSHSNLPLRD